ncbi:MAG: 3-deoxy-7-phosphoheptulonate synthase [Deltaproteobacteria bacterium]|nr:3-deoxy-7-phosphoheptulonate synthase [Deltaproteobacteria bacterium]
MREQLPGEPEAGSALRVLRGVRRETTRVSIGGVEVGGDEFVVVAGPCAVEGEEQVNTTADAVARAGARVLRGGVFKPRTSPYSFQGLGLPGLKHLHEAGRRRGLPVVAEVMSEDQIEPMLPFVGALQVGARNMQNFSLLKALGRTRVPVLLKRGMAATVDEWLLAAEYVLDGGNPNVVLCERGIRTFEHSTRFTLDLAGVAVAKSRSHLPVLVDPSHATGIPELVAPMSFAAAAAGADGVMIEVHPRPAEARSDGAQALTPDLFDDLMARLAGFVLAAGRRLGPAGTRLSLQAGAR